jgi:hypothetical protein
LFVDIADHHSCLLILLTIAVVCWYCWPSQLFVDIADHHGCLLILLTITVVCWYCWPSQLFVDTADHHGCLLILLTITVVCWYCWPSHGLNFLFISNPSSFFYFSVIHSSNQSGSLEYKY